MIHKPKLLILLGAGATIPWGGKTTADLSDIVLKTDGYYTKLKSSGKPWGYHFRQLLADYYQVDKTAISFEDVLEVIEELWSYFYHRGLNNPKWIRPSMPSLFEIARHIDENIGFDRNQLNARKGDSEDVLKCVYFGNLYYDILGNIIFEIKKYEDNFIKYEFRNLREKFADFVQKLNENFSLRCYSLNYDNMLALIPGLPTFYDGTINDSGQFSYEKIIQDDAINCFYHLHGSIHYNTSPNPGIGEYTMINSGQVDFNPAIPRPRHLLGYPILPSIIITGKNKLAKTLMKPFNAFNYSFRRDCVDSCAIITIGYSYRDAHINNCIYSAIKGNSSKKVIHVTKVEPKNLNQQGNELSRALATISDIILEQTIDDGWYVDSKYPIKTYIHGLEEFIKPNGYKYLIETIRKQ